MRRILAVVVMTLVAVSCSTVPVTGRTSLSLIPEAELASMSLSSYQQFLAEAPLSTDPEAIATVRRVGERMAGATEAYLRSLGLSTATFAWEFNVVDEPETLNAWVMPGGKVVVYTGILTVAENDEGLATVMGHEIAHIVAKHGNERMSQGLLTQMGGVALSVALRENSALTQGLFMQAYGAGAQVGLLLPYSRLHESDADRCGRTRVAMAAYDPRAAIGFWERLAARGGERPPAFLSTHPAPESRIANIRQYLPEALAVYQPQ